MGTLYTTEAHQNWEWVGLCQIKEPILSQICYPPQLVDFPPNEKRLEETLGLKPKTSSCRFLGKCDQHNPEEGPQMCYLRSVGSAKGWAVLDAATCHPVSPSRGPFHSCRVLATGVAFWELPSKNCKVTLWGRGSLHSGWQRIYLFLCHQLSGVGHKDLDAWLQGGTNLKGLHRARVFTPWNHPRTLWFHYLVASPLPNINSLIVFHTTTELF